MNNQDDLIPMLQEVPSEREETKIPLPIINDISHESDRNVNRGKVPTVIPKEKRSNRTLH